MDKLVKREIDLNDEVLFEAGSPSMRPNLITYYACAVWFTFYRYGWLYIHEENITFEAPWMMYGKLVIRFDEISALTKEPNSIKITSKNQQELCLYFLNNIIETYEILEHLWKLWINRLALQAELEIEPLYKHEERVNYKSKSLQEGSDMLSVQSKFKRSLSTSNIGSNNIQNSNNIQSSNIATSSNNNNNNNNSQSSSLATNDPKFLQTIESKLSQLSVESQAIYRNPSETSLTEQLEDQSLGITPNETPPSSPLLSPRSKTKPTSITSISSPASSSFGVPSSTTTSTSSRPKKNSTLFLLESEMQNLRFQKLFKLPPSESVLYQSKTSMWHDNSYKSGNLLISSNFLCFQSIQDSLKFVFPFLIIRDISEPKPLPKLGFGITIVTDTGAICLCFDHVDPILQKKMEAIKACIQPSKNMSILSDASCHLKLGFGDQQIFKKKVEVQFHEGYLEDQKKMEKKWWKYLKKFGIGSAMLHSVELERLLALGSIPDLMRGSAWKSLSGITYKALVEDITYDEIVDRIRIDERPSQSERVYVEHIIELDLRRSMPEHPYYQCEEGISALRRVLTAYAYRNPVVSYCQGMNFVASALLLFLNENDTFWALAYLCEDVFPELWRPRLFGVRIVQEVMDKVLDMFVPGLTSACPDYPPNLAMMTWIPTFLVGRVPLEYSLRMLDHIFYYGADALYWVLLATFELMVKKNGQMSIDTLLTFASPQQTGLETTTHDFANIFALAFSKEMRFNKLPSEMIDKMACTRKMILVHELIEKARSTKLKSLETLTEEWKLNKTELESLYSRYHKITDKADAGLMSFKRFVSEYPKIFTMWLPQVNLFNLLQDAIEAYKTNNAEESGLVKTTTSIQGSKSMVQFISKLFSQFDTNNDGYLSIEEWIIGLAKIFKSNGVDALRICLKLVATNNLITTATHTHALVLFSFTFTTKQTDSPDSRTRYI